MPEDLQLMVIEKMLDLLTEGSLRNMDKSAG